MLAFFVALYIYNVSRPFLSIAYLGSNIIVFGNSGTITGLEVCFQNRVVDRLWLGEITIINDGNRVLKRDDIPSKDPLSITLTGNAVLLGEPEILQRSRHACGFDLRTCSENSILFQFEYMDVGDRCVVRLLHDGGPDTEVKLTGSIKGGVPRRRTRHSRVRKTVATMATLISLGVSILTIVVVFLILWRFGVSKGWVIGLSHGLAVYTAIALCLLVSLPRLQSIAQRRLRFRIRRARGLEG